MALMEETVIDTDLGGFLNHDLAQYHVPSCADVLGLEAEWIDEDDPHLNPMGAKGIGEIGIVGTAAAIANACTTRPAGVSATCRSLPRNWSARA